MEIDQDEREEGEYDDDDDDDDDNNRENNYNYNYNNNNNNNYNNINNNHNYNHDNDNDIIEIEEEEEEEDYEMQERKKEEEYQDQDGDEDRDEDRDEDEHEHDQINSNSNNNSIHNNTNNNNNNNNNNNINTITTNNINTTTTTTNNITNNNNNNNNNNNININTNTGYNKKNLVMYDGKCRILREHYNILNDIHEGTYGRVKRAECVATGEQKAIKFVKISSETTHSGFPKSGLREMNILLSLHHENVVKLEEIVIDNRIDRVGMVLEFCEQDLHAFLKVMLESFNTSELKCLMKQLLEGVAYLHQNWVIHRDLKTANLLLDHGTLKICDFGMARRFTEPRIQMTPQCITLWYRAPEMLIDMPKYGPEVDIWSVGCVMAEMLLRRPLFEVGEAQNNEAYILSLILERIGTPTDHNWQEFKEYFHQSCVFKQNVRFPRTDSSHHRSSSSTGMFISPWLRQTFGSGAVSVGDRITLSNAGIDLMSRLLRLNPKDRITAKDACDHVWFTEAPVAIDKRLFKTCPSVNKQSRKQALQAADQRKKHLKRVTGGFMHT